LILSLQLSPEFFVPAWVIREPGTELGLRDLTGIDENLITNDEDNTNVSGRGRLGLAGLRRRPFFFIHTGFYRV
jgi:hypothetical protein